MSEDIRKTKERAAKMRRFVTNEGREGVLFSDGTIILREPDGFGFLGVASLEALALDLPDLEIIWLDRSALDEAKEEKPQSEIVEADEYRAIKYTGLNAKDLVEFMKGRCQSICDVGAYGPAESDRMIEIMVDVGITGVPFPSVQPLIIKPGLWLVRSDLGHQPIFSVMEDMAIDHLRARSTS